MTRRHRLAVRFDEPVWREAIRGFSGRPLQIATSTRARIERSGVALAALLPRAALGADGSELAGCAKLYPPFTEQPASHAKRKPRARRAVSRSYRGAMSSHRAGRAVNGARFDADLDSEEPA